MERNGNGTDDETIGILYPGRKVRVGEGEGAREVAVYPLALRQLREFSAIATEASARFVRLLDTALEADQAGGFRVRDGGIERLAPEVLAFATGEGLDLVNACVSGCDVRDLAHWDLAPVIEAWVVESFGTEKKIRPWIDMAERLLSRMLGKPVSIWAMFSKGLSRAVTDSNRSSTSDSPDSPTTDGPPDRSSSSPPA